MIVKIRDKQYQLLPQKALYRADLKSLFIADAHIGKVSHFRKSGIAVPQKVSGDNLSNLRELLSITSPAKVFFLGDLFHSDQNIEWKRFNDLILEFPKVAFTLVKGNHDILPQQMYDDSTLEIVDEGFIIEDLLLTHYPLEKPNTEFINLCGHIHPGVTIKGKGRQRLRLPAFIERNNQIILPAFGLFTGLHIENTYKNVSYYAVLTKSVAKIDSAAILKK